MSGCISHLVLCGFLSGTERGIFTPTAVSSRPRKFFRNYEELEDRKPELLYDKPSIKTYLEHCRNKASQVIAAETAETLKARAGFKGREFPRAELHVYNIRHIQNHAAQLNLRLYIDHNEDIVWVGSGWREV
ncbi:hypothetical protein HY230_02615 [Candidatus Acetothermia bacterium]|nr:hypothetical protein [Candidatus Acetothermia bacterium]